MNGTARHIPENCRDGVVVRVKNCRNVGIVLEWNDVTAPALALEAVKRGAGVYGIRYGLRQVPMLDPCSKKVDRLWRLRRRADCRPCARALTNGQGKHGRLRVKAVANASVPERRYGTVECLIAGGVENIVVNIDST